LQINHNFEKEKSLNSFKSEKLYRNFRPRKKTLPYLDNLIKRTMTKFSEHTSKIILQRFKFENIKKISIAQVPTKLN